MRQFEIAAADRGVVVDIGFGRSPARQRKGPARILEELLGGRPIVGLSEGGILHRATMAPNAHCVLDQDQHRDKLSAQSNSEIKHRSRPGLIPAMNLA